MSHLIHFSFFSFTDSAPTEIYTLSLHDALPISISTIATIPAVAAIPARLAPRLGFGEQAAALGEIENFALVQQAPQPAPRSEEHTSELQSHVNLVCRLLLEKKK